MVLAVVFAVSNRDPATIDLWPLDMTLVVPMYLIVLLTLFVGFLLGAIVAWISAGSARGRARSALYRAEQLERENARLRTAPRAPAANRPSGSTQLARSGGTQVTTRAAE
jgi:uncharacterized integral membrane protein